MGEMNATRIPAGALGSRLRTDVPQPGDDRRISGRVPGFGFYRISGRRGCSGHRPVFRRRDPYLLRLRPGICRADDEVLGKPDTVTGGMTWPLPCLRTVWSPR